MNASLKEFKAINNFDFFIKYTEIDYDSADFITGSHNHEDCEIYINLTGDVSFVVEDKIYPIKPGDIIVTRPFEYHHCVYHSNKLHKHFWILFTPSGNEELLDIFFNRKLGESNHLSLSPSAFEQLRSLCFDMVSNNEAEYKKYYHFFKILDLLHNAEVKDNNSAIYPQDISKAIDFITRNFAEHITISDVASNSNVSINTLERHFQQFFNTESAVVYSIIALFVCRCNDVWMFSISERE